MAKRIVAATFWFLAVSYFWHFGGALYGFPSALGGPVALGIAMLVGIDPFGLVWKRRSDRRIARIPDAAAPADGRQVTLPGA